MSTSTSFADFDESMNRRQDQLFLVSCVSVKHCRPLPAKELYCSDWFLKARAYVEAQKRDWHILSAKYGLVHPETVINPYNVTLKGMTARERIEWSEKVLSELKDKCNKESLVTILAGLRYREHIVPALKSWGCRIALPLEGLGIGQQLRWLKRAL